MTKLNNNWEKTLELLRDDMSDAAFEAWICPFSPVSLDTNKKILYIEAEGEYVVKRLNDRYLQLLQDAVKITFEEPLSVVAKLKENNKSKSNSSTKKNGNVYLSNDSFDEEYYLNPTFNFENFIVGNNNEFAYAAAYAVAESPAHKYNPLFLYGDSGLGKTHLMHAIGHHILKNHPEKKVLYVSSEMFTNELINAIRFTDSVSQFKRKYRNIDVLLIDDIQFLEGKVETQREFFHTFNTLYDRNKQIIISSDRPPQKLSKLDERLTSRFLWNVTADLQPPDYETRVAILRSKAEMENIVITNDVSNVISFIAEKIKYNVRELVGAWNGIISFSTLMNKPISLSITKTVLKDIISESDTKITVEMIKKIVCKHYEITIKDIESSKRSRNIAFPRQIAMYLCKELTGNSLPQIGKLFGGRDHTTVMHAHKKISTSYNVDIDLTETIDELIHKINSN